MRLRTARELRGLAQYASIAIPALRTELSVLDVMLSANKADGGFIRPNVEGQAAEEAAWQAWDETVELLRIWFEVPYESSFEATFDEMLTPRELLAIPGRGERLRLVGGDATLEVIGTLDWKSKAFMREPAGVMLEVLRGARILAGRAARCLPMARRSRRHGNAGPRHPRKARGATLPSGRGQRQSH